MPIEHSISAINEAGLEFSFSAQFIYFIESPQELSQDESDRLEALLQAGPAELPGVVPGTVLKSSGNLAIFQMTVVFSGFLVYSAATSRESNRWRSCSGGT